MHHKDYFMLNKDWTQKIEFWDCYFPCALKTIQLNGKHIVDISTNLDQRTIKGLSIEFSLSEDEDDEEFPYWILFHFFGNMYTYYPRQPYSSTIFYIPITTETFEFFKNNYKKLRLKKFTNKVHNKFNLDAKLFETWCSVGIQFEFADRYKDETFDFAEIGNYVFDYLGLVV